MTFTLNAHSHRLCFDFSNLSVMASKTATPGPQPSSEVQAVGQDEKHVVTDVTSNQSDDESFKDFSIQWKVIALVLGVMLSWGSSFSENTLGPLKSTFKENLEINNAQVSIANHES